MSEDIHCRSMKTLEMNDDKGIVTLDDCGNHTRSSAYIPQRRFMKRNKNVVYITGGSVMLLLLVAILLVISFKKSPTYISVTEHKILQSSQSSNNETSSHTEQPIRLSRALIMISGRNCWAVNTSSWNWHLLRQTKRNIVAFDFNVNESISWIERNSSMVSSLNHNLSLPYPKKLEAQAMAIDYITNKLYVIDKDAGTLNVVDIPREQTGIVLPDLRNPHDIVLDPLMGFVFITQLHTSLLRCDMDGSSLMEIVKNSYISAITINRKSKRIYWLADFNVIETSDYEGVNRLIFYKSDDIKDYIVNLVFHDNQLFWLLDSFKSNTTIVYSCHSNGILCDHLLERAVPFSTKNIRAAPESIDTSKGNPCTTNNGNCEQLCLLSTTGHSCACKIGWQLSTNGKTCSAVRKFLIYTQGHHFRGRILDSSRQTFVDAFSPTRFSVLSLKKKNSVDFDRGWAFDEVYFSDDLCIYRFNLTDGNQTKVYHMPDFKNYHIEGLVVDRHSDNFYFCKKSNNARDESIVIMTKKEKILEKTLTSIQMDDVSRYSLALNSEYMFYSLKKMHMITRMNYETNQTIGYRDLSGSTHNALAIDQKENLLYWIDTSNSSHVDISSSHMVSNDDTIHWFWVDLPVVSVTTFHIHQRWLYIGDEANIWRFDKKTGQDMTNVVSNHEWNSDMKIFGGQVFDLNLLYDERKSACATDNGGCEQFCFHRKTVSCGCRDRMRIVQDVYCI